MIKCKTNSLFIVLMLLVPSLAFALPGAHDASSGLGFTCNSCHVAPNTYGNTDATYANNVCLTCHRAGDANTVKAFAKEDFADIAATSTVPRTTPVKTSHKWLGSEVNAKAKALKPVDATRYGLNQSGGFSSTMACMRCHSVHGWTAEQKTAPFLRTANDTDQMCLNCHRERAKITHTFGTHPVNISYTSAVKAKPSQFKLVGSEPYRNAANPTAEMKNKKGIVVCSSCHGVHVADSDSSTFDTYSTSNRGLLSASDGSLLRVSKRGANNQADALNICTNCHTKTHSGQINQHTKSTVVECNDCHSAHVDVLDPADPVQTPNKFLLRRYVNYSGVKGNVTTLPTYRKRLVYTDAVNVNKWASADGTGVCQACHALPDTVTQHSDYAQVKDGCIVCHANAPHTDTAPAGCTGCHGSPPQNNLTTADSNGRAAGYNNYDETTTPHLSHTTKGVACIDCHGAKSPNHALATPIADATYPYFYVFKPTPWSAGTKAGSNATYTHNTTPTASTCNLVYCHSDGTTLNPTAPNFLAGQAAVGWKSGTGAGTAGSIIGTVNECITCHDNKTTTFKGSHQKHRTIGYKCATCHTGTVASGDSPITGSANHVNTVKDVQFSNTSAAKGSYISGTKTCSVACHSDGKVSFSAPVWGSGIIACGSCHKTAAVGSLATGGHAIHFSGTVLGAADNVCTNCHGHNGSGATHVNGGDINVTAGCSTNTCHASIAAPAWTATTSNNTCTKCHGTGTAGTIDVTNRYLVAPSDATAADTGKVSSNVKTGAHQTHLRYLNGFSNYSTVDYRCEGCHGSIPATGKHSDGSSTPVWSATNIATNHGARTNVSLVFNTTNKTCSNTYCHNPAGAGGTLTSAGTATTPVWTDATYVDNTGKSAANCNKCHGVPNGVDFPTHGNLPITADCSGCHGHNGGAGGSVGQRHIDGIKYANGACDTCHGYPPVSSAEFAAKGAGNFADAKTATAGGAGFHTTHLLPTIVKTDGWAPCLACHPSTSHNTGGGVVSASNVDVNGPNNLTYQFDESRPKRYNRTADAANRTCSNVSCHFQPTPAWY